MEVAEDIQTFSHQHESGEVYVADSLEAVRDMCTALGGLTLEEVGLLLELEAMGNEQLATEEHAKPREHLTEKAAEEKARQEPSSKEAVEPADPEPKASFETKPVVETADPIIELHVLETIARADVPQTEQEPIEPKAVAFEVVDEPPAIIEEVPVLEMARIHEEEEQRVESFKVEKVVETPTAVKVVEDTPEVRPDEPVVPTLQPIEMPQPILDDLDIAELAVVEPEEPVEPVSPEPAALPEAIEETMADAVVVEEPLDLLGSVEQDDMQITADEWEALLAIEGLPSVETDDQEDNSVSYEAYTEIDWEGLPAVSEIPGSETLATDDITLIDEEIIDRILYSPVEDEPAPVGLVAESQSIETIAELPSPPEEIQTVISRVAEVLEQPDTDTATEVQQIIEEIISLPIQVEAASEANAEDIEETLEELFVELFEALDIEHTPELVESFVTLTKLHYFDTLRVPTEDADEVVSMAPHNLGTQEFLQKLRHGLSAMKQTVLHIYEIGKSALRLYSLYGPATLVPQKIGPLLQIQAQYLGT